jgi:hypothetical protein
MDDEDADHEVKVQQRFACTGARNLIVSEDFTAIGVVLEVMEAPGQGIELMMPVEAAESLVLVLQLAIDKARRGSHSGFDELPPR